MIVLVILYKRQDYTKLCLEHLAQCRGIDKCKVYFQVDPSNTEVSALARGWTASPCSVEVNRARLGCNLNMLVGLWRAFTADEFVGVIEDDVLVSEDWLEFVQRPEFKRPDINAICTFRNHQEKPEPDYESVITSSSFCPWGWATWRDRFHEMAKTWQGLHTAMSWDTSVNLKYFQNHGQSVIYPTLGRSYNCGAKDGTYCPSVADWKKFNFTPWWAGNLKDGLTPGE